MTQSHDGAEARRDAALSPHHHRKPGTLIFVSVLILIRLFGGATLGVWQVKHLAWKLDLIDRVHAPASPAPGPDTWSTVTRDADEYRHVRITGRFLNSRETLVRATKDLGSGYWVLTPLESARGFTVLINRGFVPPERKDSATIA